MQRYFRAFITSMTGALCSLAGPHAGAQAIPRGQYVFEIKGEMFSTYMFSHDSLFVTMLSGDMGAFYGEGKFRIRDNKLILNFDSTGVARRKTDRIIMPTGTDTLTIMNVKEKSFDLQCNYTGRIETYRRKQIKPSKNKR